MKRYRMRHATTSAAADGQISAEICPMRHAEKHSVFLAHQKCYSISQCPVRDNPRRISADVACREPGDAPCGVANRIFVATKIRGTATVGSSYIKNSHIKISI